MDYQVFVYGEIGLDNLIRIPQLPDAERAAEVASDTYHVGGAGSNVAVLLASWGIRVGISGNVLGDDLYGVQMLNWLKEYPSLDIQHIEIVAGEKSPFCRIMILPNGDRAVLFYNAATIPMTKLTSGMLGNVKFAALDLNGREERIEAARTIHQAGAKLIVGDLWELGHPVLPLAGVITNSAGLTRLKLGDVDVVQHAYALHQISHGIVITTNGPHPVHVIDQEGEEFWVHPLKVPVIDATGAGDSLKSGVIFGLVQGWTLEECVKWGVAASALTVQENGAVTHPPAIRKINSLFEQIRVTKTYGVNHE